MVLFIKSVLVEILPLVASQGCPFTGQEKRGILSDEPSLTTLESSFESTRRRLRLCSAKLDYFALKADLKAVLRESQPWWPADFGTYGGLFIRLSWHSAGTYRAIDGRGGGGMGQQRFAPLNSWPDNGNLDKARRLLWPLKQKYGRSISWADLILLAGNVALEDMGFPVSGFGAGRPDTWQSDESVYWGSETTFVPEGNDIRYNGSTDFIGRASQLEKPLGASHMGLIYVNPQGPNGNGDSIASALDIRATFGRMGMNDSETVALIAGGHAFGKTHGASTAVEGPPPEGAPIEAQDFGWANSVGTGSGNDAVTSGLESLVHNSWTLVKSPAGAVQFEALNGTVDYPNPFNDTFRRATMLVSDLALLHDPIYKPIVESWAADFNLLTTAFAAAWYKLLHRDMGPRARYLGPEIPKQQFIWQDPLPVVNYTAITAADQAALKETIIGTACLTVSNLISVAWASASTFRGGDKRGGTNSARISLEPQVSWPVNTPTQLKTVLAALNTIKDNFNIACKSRQVSLADLIVLAGNAAIEKAAPGVTDDFTVGRVDATQASTDIASFEDLNPQGDGFRNFRNTSGWATARDEELLVDKAQQLTLTAPEMTVLVGGLRTLGFNYNGGSAGVLTSNPGTLSNDFFVNLLDMGTVWEPSAADFSGKNRTTGAEKWTVTRADVVFGSHAELRAIAEVYAEDSELMVASFVAAWTKVMNLDRFDVKK